MCGAEAVAPWPGPRLITFGYCDATDIFVNGQKVFQGDAAYFSRARSSSPARSA